MLETIFLKEKVIVCRYVTGFCLHILRARWDGEYFIIESLSEVNIISLPIWLIFPLRSQSLSQCQKVYIAS